MFLENSIAYQNQILSSEKLQALLLTLKEQKTEDDSWFYFRKVQEKRPPTNFSPVTSTNVRISPENFLTFSFNPFATLM